MAWIHRSIAVWIYGLVGPVWFVIWVCSPGVDGLRSCPIGYVRSLTGSDFCYRRKEPETFQDLYKDCSRNIFTLELHLPIHEPRAVWTNYKNVYPGGPFLDMSFTSHFGHELDSKYEVKYQNPSPMVEEDLCLVKDPVQNYTAVRCDEKHYRYCAIKMTPDAEDDIVKENCADIKDSYSFLSPIPSCLSVQSGTKDGGKSGWNETVPVRATWTQAQALCEKKGGSSILNRGWRYIHEFPTTDSNRTKTYPLGIIMTSDHSLLRYDAAGDHAEIPKSEWYFKNSTEGSKLHGALSSSDSSESYWQLVNSTYVFFDVICERTVQSRNVSIHLTVDPENKLVLTTSETIDAEDLYCLTDAVIKFPNTVSAKSDADNKFILSPKSEDGYYWCIYKDPITFKAVESNKVLFIRERDSLLNVYAVKAQIHKSYKKPNLGSRLPKWKKQLKEYIYYTSKYVQYNGVLPDENNTTTILMNFKKSTGTVNLDDERVIRSMRVKRIYLNGRTILFHVELYPDMVAVMPGRWGSIDVVHMKPVYYCKQFGLIVPRAPLGEAVTAGCTTYKCVGDFNEGVQWSMTAREGCVSSTTQKMLLKFADEVTLLMPTLHPPLRTDTNYRENGSDSSEEALEYRPPKPSTTRAPEHDTTAETVVTVTTTTEEVVTATTLETTSTEYTSPEYTSPEYTSTEYTSPESTTAEVVITTPTPLPPEDQLHQVLDDLDRLVNDTISMDNITGVFVQVNNILEEGDDLEIPGRLLHLLDQLGSVVDLNGSHTAAAVGTNLAILVGDADPARPIQGLKISTRDSDQFTNDTFNFFAEPVTSEMLQADRNEVVVQLPPSVVSGARRISFVVFRNSRAFRPAPAAPGPARVNSRVLSISVHNLTTFERGEVIDIHMSPITGDISRNESRACAYWHFTGDDGQGGYWSQDGCRLVRAARPGLLDTCRCDHLTHFAEILVPRAVFSETDETALELISVIGCCLSILGLTAVGVTAVLFRSWRRDFNNKIWLQLCISIAVMATCFLVVVFAKFERYNVPCMLVGIALHYSVLASFCWMLVAAVISYRRLVLVFTREASHKLLRASAFAYGAPCAVIGVLLSAAPQSYAGRYEDKTPSAAFCYPSGLGLWLAVYAPVALMILANWILFALIVRSVFASKRIQRHGDSNEALRCASVSCLLVFLFGLPWVFGLFAYNVGAAYLFTVTATFQGFILFLFFVLGNTKTRDMWLNKLKIKQTRKVPVTSSTVTNRSVIGYRGNPPTAAGAKQARPRSLTSTDDSKFS